MRENRFLKALYATVTTPPFLNALAAAVAIGVAVLLVVLLLGR